MQYQKKLAVLLIAGSLLGLPISGQTHDALFDDVVARALAASGYRASSVTYVDRHGDIQVCDTLMFRGEGIVDCHDPTPIPNLERQAKLKEDLAYRAREDKRWKDRNQAWYATHGLGADGLPASSTNPLAVAPSAQQIKQHAEPEVPKLAPTATCGPVCTELLQSILVTFAQERAKKEEAEVAKIAAMVQQ